MTTFYDLSQPIKIELLHETRQIYRVQSQVFRDIWESGEKQPVDSVGHSYCFE